MIVAKPDSLQSALNDAASKNELVRCENGATFNPRGVMVPAGVTLDARTARFRSPGGGRMFAFESEGIMWGGHVIADDSYGGTVFTIEAATGETISGPTGPFGSFVEGQGAQAPCTPMELRARDGGTVDGVQAQFQAHHCAGTLDVVAEESGTIRNCDVYAWNDQSDYFVRQRGNGEQTGNCWFGHNQPEKDQAEHQWYVNAPNAHDEWCEGYLWDPHRMKRPWVVHIEQSAGNIRYANAQDRHIDQHNEFFKFIDDSGSAGNRPIALNRLADEKRSGLRFPAERFETGRLYEAAGLIDDSDSGSEPEPTPDPEPEPDTVTFEIRGVGSGSGRQYSFDCPDGEIYATESIGGPDTISSDRKSATGGVQPGNSDVYDVTATPANVSGDLSGLEFYLDSERFDPDDDAPDDPDGPTVMEDFEGDSPLSKYSGGTGSFTLDTASPLEGSASLASTSGRDEMATDQISTPRGYEYLTVVETQPDSYQRILFNVQDTTAPMADCYAVWFGGEWDDIAIQERQGNDRENIVKASYDFSGSEQYVVGVSSTDSHVWATLYDTNGNAITETPKMDSSIHSGGYLGYASGPVTGVKWDYTTQRSIDSGDRDPDSGTTTLTIESDDDSQVYYEFTVSGDTLEKSSAYDASVDSGDTISSSTATGTVVGGRDSYEFSGELETFAADGNTTINLDGQQANADSVVRINTLTIERGNDSGGIDYVFAVDSGDVMKSDALGASINHYDEISDDGSSVSGNVYGGRDSYQFSGEFTSSSASGDLNVYMNGRVINSE